MIALQATDDIPPIRHCEWGRCATKQPEMTF